MKPSCISHLEAYAEILLLDSRIWQLHAIVPLSNNSILEQKVRHSKFDHIPHLPLYNEISRSHPIESSGKDIVFKKDCKNAAWRWPQVWIQDDELYLSLDAMNFCQMENWCLCVQATINNANHFSIIIPDIKDACPGYLRLSRIELVNATSFALSVKNEHHKEENVQLLRSARTACRCYIAWGLNVRSTRRKHTHMDMNDQKPRARVGPDPTQPPPHKSHQIRFTRLIGSGGSGGSDGSGGSGESLKIIMPGKNVDSYWTNKDFAVLFCCKRFRQLLKITLWPQMPW